MRKDFDTDVLFNLPCHTFSATVWNVYQIWTKYKQARYLIDKVLGEMGGACVTCVADVDKRQRHVVTLILYVSHNGCSRCTDFWLMTFDRFPVDAGSAFLSCVHSVLRLKSLTVLHMQSLTRLSLTISLNLTSSASKNHLMTFNFHDFSCVFMWQIL